MSQKKRVLFALVIAAVIVIAVFFSFAINLLFRGNDSIELPSITNTGSAGEDTPSASGDLDGVLEEFDRVVGLARLRAVHLNDSKNPRGSRKDRHEKLGFGTIGLEALARVVNHPALRGLPFYLETPNDLDGYAQEIACVKGLAGVE